MAANKIYIQVDFQAEGASAAINTLNQQIKSVSTTSTKATKEAETGFNALSVSVSQTARGMDQITQALAGLGLARAFAGMVQAADDIKKTTIAFEAMGASANEAKDAIEAIRLVAKTSPFSFDDLREMAQRLRGFGFDLRQIPTLLNTVANAAAALGKGKMGVDQITLALGQMRAKGIIQGQEAFRQLAEVGINSVKYLQVAIQKETGKAVSELDVRKMIEKQMIGSEKGVQVILDGMNKQFAGAGEKMAKELQTAQFDKFVDDLKKLGAAIENDFAPAVTKAIGGLRELVAWFGRLPPFIQDATVAIGLLVIAMTALGAVSKLGLLSWIPAGVGMIESLTKAASTLWLTLQVLFTESSLAGAFTSRLALIGTMVPAVVNLAIAVGAVAAAFAGWKAGEWLREKVEPNSWLGRLLNRDVEEKAKAFGQGARADMEATARKYQQWMTDKKLPEAANMSLIPFNKQTETELQDSIRKMRMLLDADEIATKARNARLVQESKELALHQEQIAEQILARAQARIHGAIFGINDKYASDLKELGATSKDLAKVFATMEPGKFGGFVGDVDLDKLTGKAKLIGKVYKAMADDLSLAQKKIAEENIKLMEEAEKKRLEGGKAIEEYFKDFAEAPTTAFKEHLKYVEESDKIERDTLTSRLEFEATALAADRDQRLAEADVVHRQTLEQEIAYQQTVFAIKQEYAERIRDVERELADQKYQEELTLVEALHDVKMMSDIDYLIRSTALWTANEEKKTQITVKADAGISKDRLEAAKATQTAIVEEQKKIYEKLKSSLDRVFDALLNKSTSVWQAMGNALKTAVIGAIKEIVTSRAAAALMQLFGYGTVNFGGGPRGLGGQQPTFGGGGGGTVGTGGILAALFGVRARGIGSPGAPGGTGGFTGPVATSTYGGYSGGYSPVGGAAAAGAPVAMPGFGATAAALWPAAALFGGGMAALSGIQRGGKLGLGQTIGGAAAAGVGLAHLAPTLFGTVAGGASLSALGGGVLGAGIGLAGYGLYRGGKAGIGITAAGGALTGAVLGTAIFPGIGTLLGAGIGAAVGGIAGLFRSLVKTADKKLQEKVKALYGVDIQDKNVRAQILEIAKQKYGGNLDLAIRSPEIQTLVQLYALTTAQNPVGMPQKMYGATFAQAGGSLQLQPVYSNGQLVANPYSSMPGTGSGGVYIQLNPQQANDLFEGRVVSVINNNPDSVGQAAATASRSGRSRDAQRSALLEPLTVVR